MSNDFRISVIVPVYNGEKYLKEAIDSILDQSYKPFEIILIDDGSDDKTAEIAAGYKRSLVYLYQKNSGIAASRNLGVSIAKGDYISFLDADDLWVREKLQVQKEKLGADPTMDIIFGMVKHFYSPDIAGELKKSIHCPPEPSECFLSGTMLIKKSTFLQVGFFSTDYKIGEFIDWYTKARENNLKIHCIPEVLLKRRIHNNNHTLINKHLKNDYAKIVRDMLLRRKAKAYEK